MLLTVHHLTKAYGAYTVLDGISFMLNRYDHVGIVGPNGVGKSTLLRLLTRPEECDSGTAVYAPSMTYGYLPQSTPSFYGKTIQDLIMEAVGQLHQLEERMHDLERVMARADEEELAAVLEEYNQVLTSFQDRGGYEIEYKIDTILAGLHIDYLPRQQEVQTLSGGEKARVGLATLLLQAPDILLLDEPTNHLDFASMEWLEGYVSNYPGAVLMVSHDRQFLNRTVNQIFEIDEHSHQLKTYSGNYDAYMQAKAAERVRWEEAYERQQEEIKELRRRIKEMSRTIGHSNRAPRDNDKFARYFFAQNVQSAVSSGIRAAEVQLKRIEEDPVPKPPEQLRVSSHFNTRPIQSQEVIRLQQVSKSFGERTLFRDLTFTVSARTRVVLAGPNGAGKTTLFKLILGQEQPDVGVVHVVESARIGYLPQEPYLPDLEKTVLEAYRYHQFGYEDEFIGRLLGYGLFRLEDMTKKVRQLSPGQRQKLEIACLMAQAPNVLLLDEPTNYVSLDVLEAFEHALQTFPGPIIAISHDRWFIQRFGGELWELAHERLVRGALV